MNKIEADQAGTEAMRTQLNSMCIRGTVVIGEVKWMKHPCSILEKSWDRCWA